MSEQREQLAALAHEQWAGWMAHLFRKCVKQDGGWWMPAESAQRWERQVATPYVALSEAEKDSDRKEADRVLSLLHQSQAEPCVWRDIATIPKDRWVWVAASEGKRPRSPQGRLAAAVWDADMQMFYNGLGWYGTEQFLMIHTHWSEMPQPPAPPSHPLQVQRP